MEQAHADLSSAVPPPKRVAYGPGFAFEFSEKTLQQAVVMKLARVVTGLKGAHHLLGGGLLQEAALIQRNVDELCEDVVFLTFGHVSAEIPEIHKTYLERFWGSENKSTNVPRPKIRDFIAQFQSNTIGGSTTEILNPMISIYTTYSGYAHASGRHVMEMYQGNPPKWQLDGNCEIRFQDDHMLDIENHFYRGLSAFCFGAIALNNPTLHLALLNLSETFRLSMPKEVTDTVEQTA